MSEEIKKYDKNNNIIYLKSPDNFELWREHDKNNNLIHYKDTNNYEYWYEYDENNNLIYFKHIDDYEYWYKYNKDNERIKISEKEFKEIEFRKQEKEYLNRTKCSRFELMEI